MKKPTIKKGSILDRMDGPQFSDQFWHGHVEPPKTVYISGPMSGLPEHNEPAFTEAARKLRDQGYNVLNPAENDGGSRDKSWAFYMRLDIPNVAKSDAIVVLDGWENSKGAQAEVAIAILLEIPIYDVTDFVRLDNPQAINARATVRASVEPESPSEEAFRIVRGARRADYGHPLDDYIRTAALQTAVTGVQISPEQAILNMILVKVSREVNAHKRDNLVDICGYAECLQMVYEEKERRGLK